jgi:hypothetical protein
MNAPGSEHPHAARLDGLAVGERDDDARAHVEECEACSRYVASVTQSAEAFAREEGPKAAEFVRAVRAREAARVRSARKRWWIAAGSRGSSIAAGSRGSSIAAGSAVLALAASVLLVVHGRPRGAETPEPTPVASGEEATGAPFRFKGHMQVSVIVEHEGLQSRHVGPLALDPGDRVRIEMALDHDQRVAAGVLADDGAWAELQAPALLTAGTHFSERSVAFRGDVPSGWLLAGDADALERARRTRTPTGVVAIRVQQRR